MGKINFKFVLVLALSGLFVQQLWAKEYITVESYRPPNAGIAGVSQKAVVSHAPRLTEIMSIMLEPLEQDNQYFQEKAFAAQAGEMGVPLKVGFERAVPKLSNAEGLSAFVKWQINEQGQYGTAIRLVSPEAVGSRVVLEIERLHAAAEVRFISELTDEQVIVSGEDIINNISAVSGQAKRYVGPYVEGESVIIEIILPEGVAPHETYISIPVLSHVFMDLGEVQEFGIKSADQSCMRSVACEPAYEANSAAVAALLFVEKGATYACTGTLLNDTKGSYTANFITANHCISTQAVANTIETRWFYKTSSCAGVSLDWRNTVVRGGADLLVTHKETDITLLRLKGVLPSGVAFSGWTTAPLLIGNGVSVLHHPDYSAQKVTKGRVSWFASCTEEDVFNCYQTNSDTADYAVVMNTSGVVIGGSSGSGLLSMSESGQFYYTGTLRGGQSSCSVPNGLDFYGRFDVAYKEGGLGKWLDPKVTDSGLRHTVYRLFHTRKGTHFFTASESERDNVTRIYPDYVFEGAAFYAYPKAANGLSPVYRFFNTRTGTHFYTISMAEKDAIQTSMPNFVYEGVAWYAVDKPQTGTVPLYRFFNTRTGTHFYTRIESEKNNIIAKFPSYVYEGIAYYVWIDN